MQPPAPGLQSWASPITPAHPGSKAQVLSDPSHVLIPAPCPGGGSYWVVTVPRWVTGCDPQQPGAVFWLEAGVTPAAEDFGSSTKKPTWGSVVCSR